MLLANALGSGVLESGALLGYLPELAAQLLGEPLQLPSVATWWLGEPAAFDDAWRRPERLISSRSSARRRAGAWSAPLGRRRAKRCGRASRARPQHYVAQEWVHVSQAPVLEREPSATAGARCAVDALARARSACACSRSRRRAASASCRAA